MEQNGLLRTTLSNGLTVLIQEQHHAPVATFWLWYRVGSRNEIPGITGGALDSHEGEPGPIYLQGGEHGQVAFRNIVITPAK